MNKQQLFNLIKQKKSFLCVGLDTDILKIPKHLLKFEDPIFEFNKQIIDATLPFTIAYKPNLAFYECYGAKGIISYEKTISYLNNLPEKVFIIADAKRGDIGNTSAQYAKSFFEPDDKNITVDAVTVAPYMGEDSVKPFLNFDNKWVILLALTSNLGSKDFQLQKLESGQYLYEKVLSTAIEWASDENMMFVVGATNADFLIKIREIAKNYFLLVPGVGAQGGSLQEVAKNGMNKSCGLLVNSSRNIIYASNDDNFALNAQNEAKKIQLEMEQLLEKYL